MVSARTTAELRDLMTQFLRYQNRDVIKRSLLHGLPDNIQQVIIRGSATHKDIEPSEPCATCSSLLEATGKAKATSFLMLSMKDSAVRGECQRGHLSYLMYNGPLWPESCYAEGLTVFAINADPKFSPEVRHQEMRIAMKANHDNRLAESDIEFMATQDAFFPKNFNEMEIRLSTCTVLLGIYFGTNSIIVNAFRDCHKHMFANYGDYASQASSAYFCTRVLWAYDLGLQKHLQHLRDTSIAFEDLSYSFIEDNFKQIQNEIINRRLSSTVPPQMQRQDPEEKKKRQRPKDVDSPFREQHNNRAKHGVKNDDKFDRLENPKPNPKWTIPKTIRFHDCFYKNNKMIEAPSNNGAPFCLQFFCLNLCKRGKHCNLIHTDPRDTGNEAAFDAFCRKAYSS